MKYDPAKPLVSIHIPKCAGTSFLETVLKPWYGTRLHLHYFNEEQKLMPTRYPFQGNICIHGHFNKKRGFGVCDYYPDADQLITIIRDPFELHISNYFYIRSQGESQYCNSKPVRRASDTEYDIHRYLNESRSFLLNHFPFDVREDNYRDILDSKYLLVGISEQLQETVDLLAERLDFAPVKADVVNTSERTENIPDGARALFEKRNPLEMQLYRYAWEGMQQVLASRSSGGSYDLVSKRKGKASAGEADAIQEATPVHSKDGPSIAVIVTTHNTEKFIAHCLDGLLSQTLMPSEIIVCDDASKDETLDILDSYVKRYPGLIKLIKHSVNVGIPANFNSGFRLASSDYVSMIAGDDVWMPEKLEKEYQRLVDTGAAWAYSKVTLYWSDLKFPSSTQPFWGTEEGYEGDVFDKVLQRRMSLRNYLIRRDVMENLEYFDEAVGMYEDWDFNLRMSKRYPIAHVAEANVVYLQHDGGEHTAPMYRHMAEIGKVLRKNAALVPEGQGTVRKETIQRFWPEHTMSTDRDRAAYRTTLSSLDLPYKPAKIDSNGEGMIFLVSLPRSGSTMLQRVLGSHPDIHTVAEPWLMLHPLYALKRQGMEAEYDASLSRRALDDFLEEQPGGEESYYDGVRQMGKLLYSRAVKASGKTRFLDKTPRYFYILPELARAFPRGKIVLLVRNPLAILASVLGTWFDRNIIEFESSPHFTDMIEGPALLAKAMEQFGDRVYVAQYEDLAANTREEVEKICDFLGMPFFNPMLDYGSNPAPSGAFGDPKNVNEHSTPVASYINAWQTAFDSKELYEYALSYLDRIGTSVLEALGYDKQQLSAGLLPDPAWAASQPGAVHCDATSLNREGEEAFGAGDMDRAAACFVQARALDTKNVEVCNNLTVLYWQLGDAEKALNYLAEALQLDPFDRNVVVNGGQILSALGQEQEAMLLYATYLEFKPGDDEVAALLSSQSGQPAPDEMQSVPQLEEGAVYLPAVDRDGSVEFVDSSLPGKAPDLMIADEAMLSRNPVRVDNESKSASGGGDEVLVTAIVSTYNSEKYIEGCLQDIMSQTIADRLEVIVVDSGSQQNERVIVEEFQQRYSNILYIRTDVRETIYAAWNRAIVEASGKYLTNANTDDRHLPGAYERMVCELEANPDVALVYADSAITRMENSSFEEAPLEALFRWPGFDARHLFSVCYIGPQPMWRRSVHEKYGCFDAQMTVAGDYDFWLRMVSAETFQHVPEVLGLYLDSSGSIEHAFAGACASESEAARRRNWPAAWGDRPELCDGYLVPVEDDVQYSRNSGSSVDPRISIVMPTKDRLHLLGRALDSIIGQSYRNWELIIINDGGESVHTVVDGRDAANRIRCIEFDRSRGQAAARNAALERVRGEIICYLDDDDIYLPDHLQTVVKEMVEEGNSFIYTDAVVVNETLTDGVVQEVGRSNPYAHGEYSHERLLVSNYIPINTWAHRRSCLDEVGGFDAALSSHEDWEFLLCLAERYEFRHIGKTTVEVRQRVDQIDSVTLKTLGDAEQAYRQIYARHKGSGTEELHARRQAVLDDLTKNIEYRTPASKELQECSGSSNSGFGASCLESGAALENERNVELYKQWRSQHVLENRDIALFESRMRTKWSKYPSVHFVIIDVHMDEKPVIDSVSSVASQLYSGWGLSVISGRQAITAEFESEPNLEWITTDCLEEELEKLVRESSTDWITFMFSGDQVERHFLISMLDLADVRESAEIVYSDTDSINSVGEYFGAKFKPDADIDLLRSVDYIGNGCLLKTGTVKKSIGFVSPGHYSFVYGLLLKVIEDSGESAFAHDTTILFHGYEENSRLENFPTSISRRRDYLEQHLERCGLKSQVIEGYRPGVFYVEYQHATAPLVSIIIPTKDGLEILEPCISTLLGKTGYQNFEVIVVDNNSSKPETLKYFEKIQRDDPRIRVVKYPKPYNYSAITNMAAELSKGDYLVLLNNDTEVIKEDWLDRMLSLGQRKDVGIVGVRLLHPDTTIQHAGVVVGMSSCADHSHIGAEAESPGYMGQNLTVRGVSAVTAACLLIEKELYFSVGGLDEEEFSVLFNDVDLCLKVGKKGLRIVYTPYAVLMHHGSFSLKKKVNKPDDAARRHRECLTLVQKWLPVLANDPAYNRNLCLNSRDVLPDDRFVPGWDMHRHDCLRLAAFPADDWRDGRFSAKSLLSLLQEDNGLRCMYITADGGTVKRVLEPVELERRKPDVLLFHTSMPDSYLIALEYYAAFNKSTFKVLVLDDRKCLPSRKRNKPENKKEQRIRKALTSCDRLLVPTGQLADAWSSIIDDIRVVPGSVDMQRWADLPSYERKQHLDTWMEALTPPEATSVKNGLNTGESAGSDVTQSEADKQNLQAEYRRHDDKLLEELVRKHAMNLQAIENNAGNRRQAEQSLFDATINEDGDYAGVGGSTGFVPGEQRLQYLREQFLRRVEEFDYVFPSIQLIMVADESNVVKIADTIDSLDQQIYAGWGLSIISTGPAPDQDFDALPMLEWIQSEDVGQSFIETARQSDCDWIASVMPGDTLEPEALSVFVDYINQNPGWKFIYSDEDCVDASGAQVDHKFKPDINPDYLYSSPYTGNLSLVHRDLLERISPDIGMPVASFFDLALKVLEQYGASSIGHVPALLYHQLQENERRKARDTWVKPVLEAYVRRNEIDARVLSGTVSGTCMIDYRCSDDPEVCIAIYVGSDFARVERTVASLLNKTAYSNWTIRLGVDMALAPRFDKYRSEQLSVDPLDQNASRCSYFESLAQSVDADYMVFMDSGVIVLQDNWLDRLLAQGQRPEVGVVGIRLLSPQKRVAHAGILTGIGSFGVGGCIGEGDTLEQEGYMQRSQVVQNLSAVSSACMLIKRSLFQSLQGFDARIDVQLYRDVDFCLRVSEAGARIVWTPFVTMLISDERLDTYAGDGGKSRVEQDALQLTSRWLENLASDPAYNRNLTLKQADFSREAGFKPVWDPNIRDLPRITGCGFGSYVPWAYRVAQPLAALSVAGRASHSNIPFTGKALEYLPSVVEMERIQPDVLLLHNTLHDHCLDALQQYRKVNNVFMVFSQDDLMFAVPPKSSCFKTGYKDIKKRLRTCLSMVDRLVVTSEPLADELSGFISDIRIVPNRLDANLWGALESRRGCGVKPRVGWAGAMQHHGDLEMLANAVCETADEVDWIFMGMCPEFLRPYVKEVHEYVAFSAYPETLAKLNLDLAVAPLERNRFNRSKSNLRILEYGAMGWPVIASDIEPYREAPVHLVSNQTRAWVNAIREHIHDLDTTWKAGDTLREWVRKNYLLQQHLDDWLDTLDPSDGSHCQSLAPGKASGL